jgi:hypothetical protein
MSPMIVGGFRQQNIKRAQCGRGDHPRVYAQEGWARLLRHTATVTVSVEACHCM